MTTDHVVEVLRRCLEPAGSELTAVVEPAEGFLVVMTCPLWRCAFTISEDGVNRIERDAAFRARINAFLVECFRRSPRDGRPSDKLN